MSPGGVNTGPRVVDARGHRCPIPSLKLQKTLAGAPSGARFLLLATDPMARVDIPFLMAQIGGHVVSIDQVEGVLQVVVESGPTPDVPTG